jgi:hypothetical protein
MHPRAVSFPAMGRVLRRAFKFAAAASALLCIATCVLWARSYGFYPFPHRGHGICYAMTKKPAGQRWVFLYASDGRLVGGYAAYVVARNVTGPKWANSSPGFHDARMVLGLDLSFTTEDDALYIDRKEFVERSIPMWCAALATAILPALAAARYAGRRRPGPGHCVACGYDLRASPGRCPECGKLPQAKRP